MDESIKKRPQPMQETGKRPPNFKHFATEAEWEEHRRQVKEAQDSGLVPF